MLETNPQSGGMVCLWYKRQELGKEKSEVSGLVDNGNGAGALGFHRNKGRYE